MRAFSFIVLVFSFLACGSMFAEESADSDQQPQSKKEEKIKGTKPTEEKTQATQDQNLEPKEKDKDEEKPQSYYDKQAQIAVSQINPREVFSPQIGTTWNTALDPTKANTQLGQAYLRSRDYFLDLQQKGIAPSDEEYFQMALNGTPPGQELVASYVPFRIEGANEFGELRIWNRDGSEVLREMYVAGDPHERARNRYYYASQKSDIRHYWSTSGNANPYWLQPVNDWNRSVFSKQTSGCLSYGGTRSSARFQRVNSVLDYMTSTSPNWKFRFYLGDYPENYRYYRK